MKKTILPYVFGLAAVFTISCKNTPEHPELLKTVDSLRGELIRADSMLKSVNKAEAEAIAKTIVTNNDAVAAAVNALRDTISREDAENVTSYRSLRKSFVSFADNYDKLRAATDTLTQSRNSLAHDLQHNSLAPGLDPAQSVAHEKELVGRLNQELGFMVPLVKRNKQVHDSLLPGIMSYLEVMKKKLEERNKTTK